MIFKEFDDYQSYCKVFYPTRGTVIGELEDNEHYTAQHEALYQNCLELHALHGLASEVGELHSLHQKVFQGHEFDEEHAKKELGDILWFVAEYATIHGWTLSEVAETNVAKLDARYPHGFDAEHSLHRAEGDI